MERIKRWRAEPTRSSRVHRQVKGGPRLRAVVATGAMVAVALPMLSSEAAVGGNRSIEVVTVSDVVILEGYPNGAQVKITAFRGGVAIASATKRVRGGTIELNHAGGTDCWESATTPNLRPGDRIKTRILGTRTVDSMVVRGLYIDNVVRNTTSIEVGGHVDLAGRTGVPSGPLELRVRLKGIRDIRENVRPDVSDTGTWSRTIDGVPADEAATAEVVLEWIGGGGGELTVAEPGDPATRGEKLPGCPPVERN